MKKETRVRRVHRESAVLRDKQGLPEKKVRRVHRAHRESAVLLDLLEKKVRRVHREFKVRKGNVVLLVPWVPVVIKAP